MTIVDDWKGLIVGRVDVSPEGLALRAVLGPSIGGTSGPFPATLTDDNRWYMKPLNNYQQPIVCVNEYIVGKLGRTIGAPVCECGHTPASARWAALRAPA